MDDYERVLMVKPDVFIYKIPPRASNRQYRAADWKLDEPNWSGRLRLVTKGSDCTIKLEDKITGELFAKCPIDDYPGIAIEAVSDSSRYFVIRLQDDNGRNAFIGMGFADRGDSFDMNVALQDHFKSLKTEEEISKEPIGETPKLDLGFKEGQTIKVNLNISKKSGNDGSTRARSKSSAGGSGGICILPPPPGGVKIPGPSVNKSADASPESAKPSQRTQMSDNDFLVDFGSLNINSNDNSQKKIDLNTETDLWSDFTSSVKTNDTKTDSNSWAQF